MVNDTLLGNPPKDPFLAVCTFKKGGGTSGEKITLFLSDHLKNLLILVQCDDDRL